MSAQLKRMSAMGLRRLPWMFVVVSCTVCLRSALRHFDEGVLQNMQVAMDGEIASFLPQPDIMSGIRTNDRTSRSLMDKVPSPNLERLETASGGPSSTDRSSMEYPTTPLITNDSKHGRPTRESKQTHAVATTNTRGQRAERHQPVNKDFYRANPQTASGTTAQPPPKGQSIGFVNTNDAPNDGNKTTVAYAISITDCQWSVLDAAAVHGHSIDVVQGNSTKYSHKRYAFVHDEAYRCSSTLRQLGYHVLQVGLPINVSSIATRTYQRAIETKGCCGAKELLKLYAYTLNESVAVHLDTDVLLLNPIDELFDAMLLGERKPIQAVATEGGAPLPDGRIEFMYTRDYPQGSVITNDTSKWAVQGGMFVVKTSMEKFNSILAVVLRGKYTPTKGWGRNMFGGFWGAPQIQGLLSYVYHNDTSAVELNRCVYNNLHDNMYFQTGRYEGRCTTLQPTCSNDCRKIPFEDIRMAHLTHCTKPWLCKKYFDGYGLCSRFLGRWFELRQELEETVWQQQLVTVPQEDWFYNASRGYCRRRLRREKNRRPDSMYKTMEGDYIRMKFPR